MNKRILFILLGILVIFSFSCSRNFLTSILENVPFLRINADSSEDGPFATEETTLAANDVTDPIVPQSQNLTPTPTLEDMNEGLEDLISYRTKLTTSFSGKDQSGSEINEMTVISQDAIQNLGSYHLKLYSESKSEIRQNLDLFTIGSQNYYWDQGADGVENSTCISSSNSTDGENSTFYYSSLSPDNFFNDIEKGDLLEESVWINGILTNHYAVKDSSFAGSNFVTKKADIWLAQNGGYVVRFTGEGEGETTSSISGDIVNGTMHWQYDLSDVNKLEIIELPEVCTNASREKAGIPIPENAENLQIFGALISFTSLDAPATVTDFYKQTLPPNGFSQQEISEFEDEYILVFSKEEKTFTIMVSPGEKNGSTVVISSE